MIVSFGYETHRQAETPGRDPKYAVEFIHMTHTTACMLYSWMYGDPKLHESKTPQ